MKKVYLLTTPEGAIYGAYKSQSDRDAAYIENFLSGGPELIETDLNPAPGCKYPRLYFVMIEGCLKINGLWQTERRERVSPLFRTENETNAYLCNMDDTTERITRTRWTRYLVQCKTFFDENYFNI